MRRYLIYEGAFVLEMLSLFGGIYGAQRQPAPIAVLILAVTIAAGLYFSTLRAKMRVILSLEQGPVHLRCSQCNEVLATVSPIIADLVNHLTAHMAICKGGQHES